MELLKTLDKIAEAHKVPGGTGNPSTGVPKRVLLVQH